MDTKRENELINKILNTNKARLQAESKAETNKAKADYWKKYVLLLALSNALTLLLMFLGFMYG